MLVGSYKVNEQTFTDRGVCEADFISLSSVSSCSTCTIYTDDMTSIYASKSQLSEDINNKVQVVNKRTTLPC
jgi:hypothetical protein